MVNSESHAGMEHVTVWFYIGLKIFGGTFFPTIKGLRICVGVSTIIHNHKLLQHITKDKYKHCK